MKLETENWQLPMWWILLWSFIMIAGAVGTVVSVNAVRFGRMVSAEVRQLASVSGDGRPTLEPPDFSNLPAPVRRYLVKAVPAARAPIRRVRLRHGGLFRPSLDGSWLPIRGEQYFTTDPPGFIWWARVRMAPGLWIDARDRSVEGAGNMLVKLESTVTVADSRGPELDQGALMRLLGEIAWFPTAFADARYVRWLPIDDRHARAMLDVGGRTVSGDFEFGPDGLPTQFSADRYRDVGGGASVRTPFVGRVSEFRSVDDVLVPFRVVGAWIVNGVAAEYVNFEVRQLEFDRSDPW